MPGKNTFTEKLLNLLMGLENYHSPYAQTVSDPSDLIDVLIKNASLKALGISSVLSLPQGSIGLLTFLPEFIAIYRVQAQLIKDIAALYGKEAFVTREMIVYCLFGEMNPPLFRKFIEDTGTRLIIRPLSIHALNRLLEKIGILTARKYQKNSFRWMPLLGSLLSGSLSYLDTGRIGETARKAFSRDLLMEKKSSPASSELS